MPKTVKLAIYFNDELRAVKELILPFVIGRSNDANLTIPHPMVSRRHCLIFEDKGAIRLQDLGSLNGTYLGTERVMDLALKDGTEFLIGNIRFVFNPDDTLNAPILPEAPDSDIVKAEIVLSSEDDELPPPLPPTFLQPSVPAPTTPGFIKPLPSFSLNSDDDDNDVIGLNGVIDLAYIADKEATPPPFREQK